MALCFAFSSLFSSYASSNLQEQLQNENEIALNMAGLIDSGVLFQISVGTDRMEEFKQDYNNDRENYVRVEEANRQKNKILGEKFDRQDSFSFWFFILGLLFFVLYLLVYR